ncbi:MAG: DUF1697 domain-containing protein [Gaiellaceae bacterium]
MASERKRKVVLLRGINLANRRRVSMAALRELLERLGYDDVRTHLQSGNVVLSSTLPPTKLERALERELELELGFDVAVIVRTRAELAKIVERNPLGKVATNPSHYLVSFLRAAPSTEVVRELADVDVAPEQFVLAGRELYAWHPNGVQRSRLAKEISERRLGVTATARNWNTVTKLLELTRE